MRGQAVVVTDLAPAAPFDVPTRMVLDAVPLAVVRHEGVLVGEVEALFAAAFDELGVAIESGLIDVVGPPLAVYHGDPRGPIDVEIGYPVLAAPNAPLDAAAGPPVTGSALPSGRAVARTHVGPYDGLGDAWGALVQAADGEPAGVWIEVYVTEPEATPAAELRTDLYLPLKA